MTTKNMIRKEISRQNPTNGRFDPQTEVINKKYFRPLNATSCEKFLQMFPQFATEEIKARLKKV